MRDDDDESSRPGNCCSDCASDFGGEFCNTTVTPPAEHTFPKCGEGRPWHKLSVAASASIRSQRDFGLSIWSGGQLPLSGPPVWRPRSLVKLCDRETSGNGLQPASDANHLNVRFGPKADMCTAIGDVRFTLKSRHFAPRSECTLVANHQLLTPRVAVFCRNPDLSPDVVDLHAVGGELFMEFLDAEHTAC